MFRKLEKERSDEQAIRAMQRGTGYPWNFDAKALGKYGRKKVVLNYLMQLHRHTPRLWKQTGIVQMHNNFKLLS